VITPGAFAAFATNNGPTTSPSFPVEKGDTILLTGYLLNGGTQTFTVSDTIGNTYVTSGMGSTGQWAYCPSSIDSNPANVLSFARIDASGPMPNIGLMLHCIQVYSGVYSMATPNTFSVGSGNTTSTQVFAASTGDVLAAGFSNSPLPYTPTPPAVFRGHAAQGAYGSSLMDVVATSDGPLSLEATADTIYNTRIGVVLRSHPGIALGTGGGVAVGSGNANVLGMIANPGDVIVLVAETGSGGNIVAPGQIVGPFGLSQTWELLGVTQSEESLPALPQAQMFMVRNAVAAGPSTLTLNPGGMIGYCVQTYSAVLAIGSFINSDDSSQLNPAIVPSIDAFFPVVAPGSRAVAGLAFNAGGVTIPTARRSAVAGAHAMFLVDEEFSTTGEKQMSVERTTGVSAFHQRNVVVLEPTLSSTPSGEGVWPILTKPWFVTELNL
jgi:hypothetical protein